VELGRAAEAACRSSRRSSLARGDDGEAADSARNLLAVAEAHGLAEVSGGHPSILQNKGWNLEGRFSFPMVAIIHAANSERFWSAATRKATYSSASLLAVADQAAAMAGLATLKVELDDCVKPADKTQHAFTSLRRGDSWCRCPRELSAAAIKTRWEPTNGHSTMF
jgi:hypothetical protein